MKIIERIYLYINKKGIKPAEFERMTGISNGYISKMYARHSDVGESILMQIIENCPDLNPMWLVLGEGEMFYNSNELEKNSEEIKDKLQDSDLSKIVLDKLIGEIKELSAKNEKLRIDYEDLQNKLSNNQ